MLTGTLDVGCGTFIFLEISEYCYICVNLYTHKVVINA